VEKQNPRRITTQCHRLRSLLRLSLTQHHAPLVPTPPITQPSLPSPTLLHPSPAMLLDGGGRDLVPTTDHFRISQSRPPTARCTRQLIAPQGLWEQRTSRIMTSPSPGTALLPAPVSSATTTPTWAAPWPTSSASLACRLPYLPVHTFQPKNCSGRRYISGYPDKPPRTRPACHSSRSRRVFTHTHSHTYATSTPASSYSQTTRKPSIPLFTTKRNIAYLRIHSNAN
jgi:hypothetical protein